MQIKDEATKGFILAVLAFVIWGGFYPIYFKQFDEFVGAWEILIHRIIWSSIFMAIFLYFTHHFDEIKVLLLQKRTRNLLFLSGFMISLNWGIYIYAVDNGKILEASLGYFMNPLMNILVGFLIFKERVNFIGKIAVGIVFLAVAIQFYAYAALPVIAIVLPLSFAVYIGVRKFVNVKALNGLFVETLLILPLALAYFFYIQTNDMGHFTQPKNGALLIISGIVTIVPLVMFNAATTRMKLSSLAYVQYLSPSISMLVAVFVYGESLDIYKIISFSLIWFAIFLVSSQNLIIKFKRKI